MIDDFSGVSAIIFCICIGFQCFFAQRELRGGGHCFGCGEEPFIGMFLVAEKEGL